MAEGHSLVAQIPNGIWAGGLGLQGPNSVLLVVICYANHYGDWPKGQ